MISNPQDKPFVLKHDNTYEGLAIDIYNKVLSELLKDGIVLDLDFVDADTYGSRLENGTWTGVFGMLQSSVSMLLSKNLYGKIKPPLYFSVFNMR